MAQLTTNSPLMWANTTTGYDTPEDTYEDSQAEHLTATVQRTFRIHGCLRRAVATALTTAYVALGQDWRAEAEAHYPQVFTEAAAEPAPLAAVR